MAGGQRAQIERLFLVLIVQLGDCWWQEVAGRGGALAGRDWPPVAPSGRPCLT